MVESTLPSVDKSDSIYHATAIPGSSTGGAGRNGAKSKFLTLLLLLLLMAAPAYTLLSYNKPKFARSEISYAEQSREMILNNNYISAYYHYMPCIDKPAMIYWMIIPTFKLIGQHPFAARIPSIIAGLASIAILAFALRSVFGWQTALLGGMILATSSRFVEFSSLCMTDIFLTLFDLIALLSLYAVTVDEKRRGLWFIAAAVASGCAVLTKGPVGFVLPAACFGIYLIATRQLRVIFNKYLFVALALFVAVAAPWYLMVAYKAAGSENLLGWLWHHNVERFAGNAYAYNYPWYYMVQSFFLGFAPWSVLVPFAVVSTIDKWRKKENPEQSRCELFMWLWVGLTTLFFSISKGKMNYYDLPAFTAASSVVAVQLARWINGKYKTGLVFAWIFAAALFIVGGLACVMLPHITGGSLFNWILAPLTLVVSAIFMVRSLLRGNLFKAYALAGTAIMLAIIGFAGQALPAIARQIPALDYLSAIAKDTRPYKIGMHSDFAITVDWVDHGLFFTGKIPEVLSTDQQVSDFLNQGSPVYVILPANRFEELATTTKAHARVLESRPYISDKLMISFLLKRHGNLTGPVPLLLVTNDR